MLLTLTAAAKELGVSRHTVYRLIHAGEIRRTKVHRRPMIRRDEIVRWLNRNTR